MIPNSRITGYFIHVLAIVIFLSGYAFAQSGIASIPRSVEKYDVTPSVLYFIDESQEMTFEQAVAAFDTGVGVPINETQLAIGTREAVVWCCLRVENPTNTKAYVLEITNPRLSFVDFYLGSDARNLDVVQLGAARPADNRPFRHPSPAVEVDLPAGGAKTIYWSVRNTGDMRFGATLWHRNAFLKSALSSNQMTLLMLGALAMLWMTQMLIFISLRERGYFYLSVFLLSWIFSYLAATGFGSLFIWGDATIIGERGPTIGAYLMCGSFLLFTNGLLNMPRYSLALSRLALAMVGVCVFGIAFTLASNHIFRIYLDVALTFATPAVAIAMGVLALRKGHPSAWLFLVTWGFVHFVGIFLLILRTYLLTDHWFGALLMNMLVLGSVLAWNLDLTRRVRVKMREKQKTLEAEVAARITALEEAETQLEDLARLLPICSHCKNIRDDKGYWNSVESFLCEHTQVNLTHGLCPHCLEVLYPDLAPSINRQIELNFQKTKSGENP